MTHPDPRATRLDALIRELESLNPERDGVRMCALLEEGVGLVDRGAQPQRWAGLRTWHAWLLEPVDPAGAMAAYRDALQVWSAEDERSPWLDCHEGLGRLLALQTPLTPEQRQEAIEHLEQVVDERPDFANVLAELYRSHTLGDPWLNWSRYTACLARHAAQIDSAREPERWAQVHNELATAWQWEPGADFTQAVERSLQAHAEVLAQLPSNAHAARAETRLALSGCHSARSTGSPAANAQAAQGLARQAVVDAESTDDHPLQARTRLGLARALMQVEPVDAARLLEAEGLCDEATALADPDADRPLRATIATFRASICLQRMQRGETRLADALMAHGDTALQLLQGPEAGASRRVVLQIVGDGLLLAQDHARARGVLERALAEAASGIEAAQTPAGRLERIWALRDSAALLAHCLLRLGHTHEALLQLDRGKARYWQADAIDWERDALSSLVPAGGALLVANFATDPGAVTLVTAEREHTVWLPYFGRTRVLALQRGSAAPELTGGWLLAYLERNTRPQAWQQAIEDTGRILYEELWQPLLACFPALGIRHGSELVWLHQGGSNLLPMHAAWRPDGEGGRHWLDTDHAIRYAPSISALRAARPRRNDTGTPLLVANASGDLPLTRVECAWVEQALDRPARSLYDAEATRSAVLARLPGADPVHLATHARFDLDDPLQSCVLLAQGEVLAIPTLLDTIAAQPPALLVLSACETAVTRVTSLPDEALGFVTAALHAGTRSVLAALWPVDDVATAFLVARFHQELQASGQTPARALRAAQRWLRAATAAELMALLRAARALPPPAGALAAGRRNILRATPPDARPYAAPLHWAAFTISGVE